MTKSQIRSQGEIQEIVFTLLFNNFRKNKDSRKLNNEDDIYIYSHLQNRNSKYERVLHAQAIHERRHRSQSSVHRIPIVFTSI